MPLLNGKEIPVLGLGTGLTQGDAVYNEIKIGFDAGFRHIDTADNYSNQKDLGRALKEIFSKGKIKREEVFLTSKVSVGSLTRNGTHQIVSEALRDLGVDYIDLFLLHSSSGVRESDVESYRALEDEIDSGRILGAGLSNWNVSYAQDFWDLARHKPVNIQVGILSSFLTNYWGFWVPNPNLGFLVPNQNLSYLVHVFNANSIICCVTQNLGFFI